MTSTRQSRLVRELPNHFDILETGTMLAIDPSSGSQGSLPGYALFKAGKLEDCGILRLPPGSRTLSNRLYLLHQAMSQFPQPDVLALELISPIGVGRNVVGQASLIKACGVIQSVWDVPILEVAPVTWKRFVPTNYVKSDVADACMIGLCVYQVMASLRGDTYELVLPDFGKGGK